MEAGSNATAAASLLLDAWLPADVEAADVLLDELLELEHPASVVATARVVTTSTDEPSRPADALLIKDLTVSSMSGKADLRF